MNTPPSQLDETTIPSQFSADTRLCRSDFVSVARRGYSRHMLSATRLALDRATATVEGLSALENQLLKAEAALKGKPRQAESRPAKKIEKLEMQREMALQALQAGSKRSVRLPRTRGGVGRCSEHIHAWVSLLLEDAVVSTSFFVRHEGSHNQMKDSKAL